MLNYTVTTKQLSEILSISRQYVERLAREKYLIKTARNQFDLIKSVKGYLDYLDTIKNNSKTLTQARIDFLNLQAREKEIEIKEKEKKLIPFDDVVRTWSETFSIIKQNLLTVPTKCAVLIDDDLSKNEIKHVIYNEIAKALEKICDKAIKKAGKNK